MAREASNAEEVRAGGRGEEDTRREGVATDQFEARFRVAFAERGLDLASLSASDLSELKENAWERLSPLLDEIVERWQEEHGKLSELNKIDRELRRRIVSERDSFDRDHECEGCGTHNWNYDFFVDFHGLLLCDGCADHARDKLSNLQRPLIEALEAEPTLEQARALGFELTRRDDGRLVWIGEDDDYDGGSHPYADETEALDDLVEELSVAA